jgi:hypothetical protein
MRLATRWLLETLAEGGASSAPVVLIPARVSTGTGTLADADGGAPIAPTGDAWPAYRVEPWVSADDAVGEPRPFDAISGLPIGSCYGLPAKARKAGFDAVNPSANTEGAIWDTGVGTLPITYHVRIRTFDGTWPTTINFIWFTDLADATAIFSLRFIAATSLRWRSNGLDTGINILADYRDKEIVIDTFFVLGGDPLRLHRLYIDGAFIAQQTAAATALPAIDPGPIQTAGAARSAHVMELVESWDYQLTADQMNDVVAGTGPAPLTSIPGLVSGIVNPSDATQLAIQDTGSPGDITAQAAP